MSVEGRERSTWVVVLLSVVTLGLYWYYWIWQAFREVIEDRERRPWSPAPMLAMVVLQYGGAIALWVRFGPASLEELDPTKGITDVFLWSEGLNILVSTIEVLYVVSAQNRLMRILTTTTGDTVRPHVLFYWSAGFGLLSRLPVVGVFCAVFAIALLIFWVYHVQAKLNKYWRWRVLPSAQAIGPGAQAAPAA